MKFDERSFVEMRKCLQTIEKQAFKLREMSNGIPAIEKNIRPILAFIDILKYHMVDVGEAVEEQIDSD
jgi:hypothetical protein